MLRKNYRNENMHVFFFQSVLQFINSELVYVSNLIMFGDIAIVVVTFISNRFSKFINFINKDFWSSPGRHVNVYRTKVILHMHHRVEMSVIVSMDIVKKINTYTCTWFMTVNVKLLPTSILEAHERIFWRFWWRTMRPLAPLLVTCINSRIINKMKAKTFRVALLIVQQSLFKEASTSQGMTFY